MSILGTRIEKAVQHINDVVLEEENGNRKNVTNIIIIITSKAAEDEKMLGEELMKLRSNDTLVNITISFFLFLQPAFL